MTVQGETEANEMVDQLIRAFEDTPEWTIDRVTEAMRAEMRQEYLETGQIRAVVEFDAVDDAHDEDAIEDDFDTVTALVIVLDCGLSAWAEGVFSYDDYPAIYFAGNELGRTGEGGVWHDEGRIQATSWPQRRTTVG